MVSSPVHSALSRLALALSRLAFATGYLILVAFPPQIGNCDTYSVQVQLELPQPLFDAWETGLLSPQVQLTEINANRENHTFDDRPEKSAIAHVVPPHLHSLQVHPSPLNIAMLEIV